MGRSSASSRAASASIALILASLVAGCGLSQTDGGFSRGGLGSWDPAYVWVKYRDDAVDVGAPYFVGLSGGRSSVVDDAWYDEANQYLIIVLDGVAYQYCGLPTSVWESLDAAESRGSFYKTEIKGNYDCRVNPAPNYP